MVNSVEICYFFDILVFIVYCFVVVMVFGICFGFALVVVVLVGCDIDRLRSFWLCFLFACLYCFCGLLLGYGCCVSLTVVCGGRFGV